ncbi:unnamed protein product [Mucor hiemalis]
MVSTKAITIAKEIDAARCKGNWQAIAELARRYKKHNPTGIVLEQSVLAELSLVHILKANRTESTKNFAHDSPNHVTLEARIIPKLMKPVQHQLSNALGDRDATPETTILKNVRKTNSLRRAHELKIISFTSLNMSKIILARTYFESGEYSKVIETVNEINFKTLEESSGYSHTLHMQAVVIQAISFDVLDVDNKILDAYGQVVQLVNETPNLVDRAIVDWAEEGLYRGALFALSDRCTLADVQKTMGLIRAYQKTCSSQMNSWRIHKRLVVTKFSLQYLANIYRADQYLPPVDFALTEEGKLINETEFADANRNYNHQLFSIEIIQLHTIYEKLVYSLAHFPKSGKVNTMVLDFVNRLAADFELIGGSEAEKRGYVEALNRASSKTFNSPCVIRHLFHALISLGDFEQAEHALRTYLYLVGLESKTLIDLRSTTPALAFDSFGFNTPIPITDEVEELSIANKAKKADGPQRSEEVETTENKINVLVEAVKMYCQDLSKGADAVNLAEIAEHIYKSTDNQLNLDGAQIYRVLGVAFSFLASQTFDQDCRPQYHKKALDSLRKSIEINDNSWETYYQIALQLGEMRDIYGAIPMISQSLQLNSTHLPSWHLLALLCTCPIKDNMKQALKTCEIALNEAAPILRDSWVDYSDDIAQQILLHKTQTLLVERVHGSDAALISQEALFQIFGKIVVPELIPDSTNSSNMLHEAISNGNARYGMVLSGSLGNIEPSPTVSTDNRKLNPNAASTRHRSSSNASTFTNGRTKSISSFTGRKFHLAEMFNSSDASSIKSVPSKSNNASKTSLLDPKSLVRNNKRNEGGSFTRNDINLHSFCINNEYNAKYVVTNKCYTNTPNNASKITTPTIMQNAL